MKTLSLIIAFAFGLAFGAIIEHRGQHQNPEPPKYHVSGWWDAYEGSSIKTGNQKVLYDDSGHRFWADSFQLEVGVGLHCILWREAGEEPYVTLKYK